jgi:formamidopyrimidine-DNA glycosylase
VLYQSRIHPGQPANTLLRDEVEALHKALADVIDHAVKVDAD